MDDVPGARDRDVGQFDRRAGGYETGRRGDVHRNIADRVVARALSVDERPRRILDVGCGTGYVLRRLAALLPDAEALSGIDPAPNMIGVARSSTDDPRVHFDLGVAEHLPYADGAFDLVVSTTSFDHWADQAAGLRECARVLSPGGHLLLTDLFSLLLLPTLLGSRRVKARTRARASRLIRAAGFRECRWRPTYALIIASAVATR